ncbi:uncharacterized protein V1510DRAFT_404879 [Dipodascopsis tothii]|uniref:uncharacterized protein n=1 Tax=Dipodascopsis tothii TaxID=44089 RepID=UPI0034CEB201
MSSVREIERLNEKELEAGVSEGGSWHADYKDSAYIFIGSLPFNLTEGDILAIFSQYGNPVHVKLVRDRDTGKSRGFAYLKYEDQRSTVLAVDNLNGTSVLGRTLRVDHTFYKNREDETLDDEMAFNRREDETLRERRDRHERRDSRGGRDDRRDDRRERRGDGREWRGDGRERRR